MLDLTERETAAPTSRRLKIDSNLYVCPAASASGTATCPSMCCSGDELVKEHFHLAADARVTIATFYERIHPDDREPTRVAIERSIKEHRPYDVFYRTVSAETQAEKWIRAIGRTTYAKTVVRSVLTE